MSGSNPDHPDSFTTERRKTQKIRKPSYCTWTDRHVGKHYQLWVTHQATLVGHRRAYFPDLIRSYLLLAPLGRSPPGPPASPNINLRLLHPPPPSSRSSLRMSNASRAFSLSEPRMLFARIIPYPTPCLGSDAGVSNFPNQRAVTLALRCP